MAAKLAPSGEVRQPLQGERQAGNFSAICPLMGNGLRDLRKERGWTHDQAADAVGLSRGQFIKLERSERGLTERTIGLAAKAFNVSRSRILGDQPDPAAQVADQPRGELANARLGERPALPLSSFKGPRNVPVYGTGAGGPGGDFRLNGQIIDHAPRPPGIENRRDVYVVYVIGDSVSPKYEDGDPVYVDPHRRPQPRDYVFVELWGDREEEAGDAFVKRLVRRSATDVVLFQHNPEKELHFKEKQLKRLHRIIPYPELIGI